MEEWRTNAASGPRLRASSMTNRHYSSLDERRGSGHSQLHSRASLPAYFLAGRGIGVTPTCSPDADPTMTPRGRPLHSQVRAGVPNKKPKMNAMPPDTRFAYWDYAHALPRAQARSPRFWLGSILKFPLIDQSEQEALLQSLSANPLAS